MATPRVALFVPCYVDQLFPNVAWASLELLEAQGFCVDVAAEPACCGQPLMNLGHPAAARPVAARFQRELAAYDHVVCPSGSCVAALHRHASGGLAPPGGAAARARELTQFLVEEVERPRLAVSFPHRVGVHASCHSLRDLGQGRPSELGGAGARSAPLWTLLAAVEGIRLVEPERIDECCGFGGSFCLGEPAVSGQMGRDRALDFVRAGAEIVTSVDMSCLAHLAGVIERERHPLEVLHVAEILSGRRAGAGASRR